MNVRTTTAETRQKCGGLCVLKMNSHDVFPTSVIDGKNCGSSGPSGPRGRSISKEDTPPIGTRGRCNHTAESFQWPVNGSAATPMPHSSTPSLHGVKWQC